MLARVKDRAHIKRLHVSALPLLGRGNMSTIGCLGGCAAGVLTLPKNGPTHVVSAFKRDTVRAERVHGQACLGEGSRVFRSEVFPLTHLNHPVGRVAG